MAPSMITVDGGTSLTSVVELNCQLGVKEQKYIIIYTCSTYTSLSIAVIKEGITSAVLGDSIFINSQEIRRRGIPVNMAHNSGLFISANTHSLPLAAANRNIWKLRTKNLQCILVAYSDRNLTDFEKKEHHIILQGFLAHFDCIRLPGFMALLKHGDVY